MVYNLIVPGAIILLDHVNREVIYEIFKLYIKHYDSFDSAKIRPLI